MTKQPKAWVESLLVAYADNELDPAQTERVEEIIRADPEAQAVVGVLRRSAAAVRTAFDQPLHEPVPARLLAAVGAAGDAAGQGNVVALRPRRKPASWRTAGLPLAASIAMLAIGFGAGYLEFAGRAGSGEGTYQPAAADSEAFATTLRQALDSGDLGVGLAYDDARAGVRGTVTVIGPVPTSFSDGCREFRHDWSTGGGKSSAYGVACRSSAGEWSVLTLPAKPAS